jgi:transcriptional regulator with XRE-family HTH domain
MGFKENLRSELSYSGILVKELAKKSGISQHTIENYLNVRSCMPSAEAAVRIARVLGVSVEYLITGEEINHLKNASGAISASDASAKIILQVIAGLPKKDRKIVRETVVHLGALLKTRC